MLATAFKVSCEYDFGGNIDGTIGVYSTKEKCIEQLNAVLSDHGMDYEELRSQGLANIEEIII